MSGRARAKRICQAAVGVFFNPTATLVGLARDEVGAAFDLYFPDPMSPAQRLLAALLQDFQSPDLDDDAGEHLTSVATDLFAGHGLSSAELAAIAKPELKAWATDARDRVCRRGLTTRLPGLAEAPASWNGKPPVVVDAALEGRVRALVEAFYAKFISLTLGSELRGAIDGYQTSLLQEIAARLDHLTRAPETPPPFSIPRPVPDFQGYEAERAVVRAALAGDGAVAIAALHGIGGSGKSELARKVAAEMVADFPDGQILVDMLGTTQPRTAADAMTDVLMALGAEEIDPRTREAEYRNRLRGKSLLILLDNVANSRGLNDLRPAPPTALLLTSRTRLVLPGVQPIELQHLTRPAAKALLAGILPDVADATLDTLAERCNDLPLALRVAGAYLQATGAAPDDYIETLQQRRLAHLARSAGDIERPDLDPLLILGLSYDRLADSEPDLARSFTLLAAFPADFDAAGAAAVLDLDQVETARCLGLLYRRNLLQRPSNDRYRLHDLLRELARDRAANAAATTAATRHRTHYLALLESLTAQLHDRREVRRALESFESEQPNIAEAVRRSTADGDWQAAASGLLQVGLLANALGRREAALDATEQAVEMYRPLAEEQPDAFLPNLAASLNNLGVWLSYLDRHEEALAATENAVTAYGRLAVDQPDAFLPDKAMSLDNLGTRFSDLGRHEEALVATDEAVDIRQRLADERPDLFLPDLAASLNNLGNGLGALQRHEEALAATSKAVEIYRRLADERPEGFRPDLATSLSNLADRHDEMQQTAAAIPFDAEAIRVIRDLFLALPAAHERVAATIVRRYRARCAKLGIEPDVELLASIEAVLVTLDEQKGA